jgi:hypothetical protein
MVIVFGVFFTPNEYRDVINHINNLSLFHLQLQLSAEAFEERLVRRPRQPIPSTSKIYFKTLLKARASYLLTICKKQFIWLAGTPNQML